MPAGSRLRVGEAVPAGAPALSELLPERPSPFKTSPHDGEQIEASAPRGAIDGAIAGE